VTAQVRPLHRVESPETTPRPQVFEGGDLIISYLEQLGVDHVFGIPGGAIEPLYNALARSQRRGSVRAVVARHETGAAFMAEGYARNTGRLGVCCSTTGPGATNLITGVASAFENQIPMLVITPQTPLSHSSTNSPRPS
jgi:acetolactate synthase-1/2/3 large subunit